MCKHGTETVIAMPYWLVPEKQNRTLALDSCLIDQITALWDLHIETLGCCCGHSKEPPSVIVPSNADADHIKRAVKVLKTDESRVWRILQWQLVEAAITNQKKEHHMTSNPTPTQPGETLLPCPLEGHVSQGSAATFGPGPYVSESGDPNATKYYSVVCPGCCSTAHSRSRDGVITRWNTRAAVAGPRGDMRKLARRIIDVVINSPRVVEVRMFSQPDAVDKLEDAIIALLPAAPSSPTPAETVICACGHTYNEHGGIDKRYCNICPAGTCNGVAPAESTRVAGEQWRQGMKDAAREVCDACSNEERYGPARKIEGSTRWWHGDDNIPCEAGGIWHALAKRVAATQPVTMAGRVVNISTHGEPTRVRLQEIQTSVSNGYESQYRKSGWSKALQFALKDLHFLLTFFRDDVINAATLAASDRED